MRVKSIAMDAARIAKCAQLACALEAACPKPGNVNRYHDFSDTKLEHFLASAVAIGSAAMEAAQRGGRVRYTSEYASLGLGRLIHSAVRESLEWHRGRNTNLGIAMLLIPLSAGYGMASGAEGAGDSRVRDELDRAVKAATTTDALDLYKAIRTAMPGGLGRVRGLDVLDDSSLERISLEKLTLCDVLTLSKEDSLPRELTGKMRITFEVGSPEIMRVYEETGDLALATLHGYMKILAEVPDSLIARKRGMGTAKDVSTAARRILEAGMPMREVDAFDMKIRRKDNSLNPGTTADLTASSLMVCLVKGARP